MEFLDPSICDLPEKSDENSRSAQGEAKHGKDLPNSVPFGQSGIEEDQGGQGDCANAAA